MDGDDVAIDQPDGRLEGREADLDALLGAVNRGADSGDGVVLVRGSAGIGKTTLLRHAARRWSEEGWCLLVLAPDELDRRIPYAALAQAIREASWHDAETTRLAIGLVEALNLPDRASVESVRAAGHRLFSTLRDHAPTLVAVDDVTLLDDDTVVLLADLLRRSERHPLVVATTTRSPGDRSSDVLKAFFDRAERAGSLHDLELGPLDFEAVRRVVEGRLRRPADPELVSFVQRQSDGNPFLAIETVLDLDETGSLDAGASLSQLVSKDRQLSSDRRATVLRRVLRVGEPARRLARAVALLGSVSPGRLPLCAELAGLPLSDAEHAFDLLVERGILTGDGASFRFSHQLVRDALYQELGPAQRWNGHRRAATRLRELPQCPDVDHEIARHVRETAEQGDEEAIATLYAAAERAGTSAPHSSLPWYRHTLAITPPEHPLRAEVTARLARALFLAGRTREAADTGTAALQALPDGAMRTRLVMLVVEALVKVSAIEEAVAIVDTERSRDGTPRLAARAAHIYGVAGRVVDARAAAGAVTRDLDAMTAYDRLGAVIDLVQMCCLVGFDELPPLLAELQAKATEAPRAMALNAYTTMSYALAMQGDTRGCSEMTVRAQQLFAESGWSLYRAEFVAARAQNLFNLGDWDSTLSVIDTAVGELEATGAVAFLNILHCLEARVRTHCGEWQAARQALSHRPPAGDPVHGALHASVGADLHLLTCDFAAARGLVRPHLDNPTARGMLLSQLADLEVEAGDNDAAVRALDALDQVPSARLDHATRARALLARGRAPGDLGVLQAAADLADEHRLALLRGRARLHLGEMGHVPERSLYDAIRIFQVLGAVPWRRRAAADLRARDLPVPRHRPGPSTFLTEMEAQVARLVQLGRANREIAMTVCLSVKTVEGYLSRIYAKTGCASRLELARALDEGLID